MLARSGGGIGLAVQRRDGVGCNALHIHRLVVELAVSFPIRHATPARLMVLQVPPAG